jgi:3',5'-cyclic AMP phosphodiesterase CpdA
VHLSPLPRVRLRDITLKRLTGLMNWRMRRHNSLSGDGLAALVAHMRDQHPDIVAVTGDLVNLGLEAEVNTAFNWLQTVGAPDAVCVSPGNHDAYVRGALDKARARWGEYVMGETLDPSPFPYVRRVGEVAVVVCSSAVASAPSLAIGRFEPDQAHRLARCLRLLGDAGYFRVVLIHHPPNVEARNLRLGLYGAPLFRETVAEHGAELVLHGHTHQSSMFAIPGPHGDVPVVGVAAAGAAQEESGGEAPARYNLFRIERLGSTWSCVMREFGFQRLSPEIVLRLSVRIY